MADAAAAVLAAPVCAACASPLESPTSGAVCPACWQAICPLTPPCCATCGDVLPSWRVLSRTEARCARCRRLHPALACTRALGAYDGSLGAIVHALKYDGRRSLARPLSAMMRRACSDALDGADLVVPVPLHVVRRLRRGFNQAADLAAGLGLPVVHALKRTRYTSSQTDLPAARRHANVRGAFRVVRRTRLYVRGSVIVVVDDVSTTGATLDACARALLDEGAREVRGLIAARAVSRAHGVPRR